MNTLPETILEQARSLPEGSVLSPKEFLHLGSRDAVDQTFSHLSKAGKILRVARGAYVAPVSSRWDGANTCRQVPRITAPHSPSTERQALLSARASLPGWMAQAISEEAMRS